MKPTKQLDSLDRNVILLLNRDGRTTNKELSEKLSVSEGTIRNRITRLLQAGELKISGLINPDSYSDKQLIILGINVAASKDLTRIAEAVAELPGIHSVSITTGRYDLMVEVWTDTKFGLINFINGSLTTVDGIVSTESFVIMKSYNKWISVTK